MPAKRHAISEENLVGKKGRKKEKEKTEFCSSH
jgi:hypothetical protein